MRIATLIKDRCQPKKCNSECLKYCPKVRTGVETIVIGDKGRPVISEELCAGCGICVHKCPYEAIKIIGLPEELGKDLIHQYGKNAFRLYRLPVPKQGLVTGILGPNGIGKTTALKLLSGEEIPNFGIYEKPPSKDEALQRFAGTELYDYFERLYSGMIRVSFKPQYVDKIPAAYNGMTKDLLARVAERISVEEAATMFEIEDTLHKDLSSLSGGELQRVAIAAALMKDSDAYFFDEPSSYLDIKQRLKVARIIQSLSQGKYVV
ncbi:MAG: ATP-binding cassette domain-containing protein, partial [Methanomassiliicoccales archaeon]